MRSHAEANAFACRGECGCTRRQTHLYMNVNTRLLYLASERYCMYVCMCVCIIYVCMSMYIPTCVRMFQFLQGESSSSAAGAESAVDETHVVGDEGEPVSKDEVASFPTNCSHCNSPTETRMKLVGILHFRVSYHDALCPLLVS